MHTEQAIPMDQFLLLEIKADETLRQDAKVKHLCQSLSNIALLDYAEGLWWSIHYDSAALARGLAEDAAYQAHVLARKRVDLKTAQQEALRRHRLLREQRLRLPREFARSSERLYRWREQIVREVHLADIIAGLGGEVRFGPREAHTGCPRCRGTDRFIIWPPPRSRGWCRQCGHSCDVIGFLMELWHCDFVEAVQKIAHEYLHVGPEDELELV